MASSARSLYWVGSALKDLRAFPAEVRQDAGYALYSAQLGKKHPKAVPLKGFRGASVLEVRLPFDGDTYRVVYSVRYPGIVFVLHAFKKKSKKGVSTPREDLSRIEQRLAAAYEIYKRTEDW